MARPGLGLMMGALLLPLPPVCEVILFKQFHWHMSPPKGVCVPEVVTLGQESSSARAE